MLPPVDEAILQNNPDFAALYKTLTTVVLNPNGSTKNDPAAKEREAVKEELHTHRIKAVKHRLLIDAISAANPAETTNKPTLRRPRAAPPSPQAQPDSSSSSSLSPDLLDLLLLLPSLLTAPSSSLSPESVTLLLTNPPFTTLPTLLPSLTPSISSSLISSAASLSRLLNPTTNPSFIHRTIPSLPKQATTLLSTLSTSKHDLVRSRAAAASTHLTRLLCLHAEALSQLVRSLEAKHGNVARSLELRAAEVAVSAARLERDAAAMVGSVRAEVYTPAAAKALGNYSAHLGDARGRVREEIRGLGEALGGYGACVDGEGGRGGEDEAKERTMREMARVHRDMVRQVEEARADLERLHRA